MERRNKIRKPSEMSGDSRRRGQTKVIAVFLTEDVVIYRTSIAGRRVEIVWQTFSVLSARSYGAGVRTR
jgi:hypothetical protein